MDPQNNPPLPTPNPDGSMPDILLSEKQDTSKRNKIILVVLLGIIIVCCLYLVVIVIKLNLPFFSLDSTQEEKKQAPNLATIRSVTGSEVKINHNNESQVCGIEFVGIEDLNIEIKEDARLGCTFSAKGENPKYTFLMQTETADWNATVKQLESIEGVSIKNLNVDGAEGVEASVTEGKYSDAVKYIKSGVFRKGKLIFQYSFFSDPSRSTADFSTLDRILESIRFNGVEADYEKIFVDQTQAAYAKANNTKRRSDVNAILNAVLQYAADNNGAFPSIITNIPKEVSSSQVDICSFLLPEYLAGLPVDPTVNDGSPITSCSSGYKTGYMISAQPEVITVSAPSAELGENISVSR